MGVTVTAGLEGVANRVISGMAAKLRVAVLDEDGAAVVPRGDMTVTSVLPTGSVVRKSVGHVHHAVSRHALDRMGMLSAPGCHQLAVEVEIDGGVARSNTILVDVEEPSYVDGDLFVGPPGDRRYFFATGLHRGLESQLVVTRLEPRDAASEGLYPATLDIPASARHIRMPSGELAFFLKMSWELVWAEHEHIVAASFNPLIRRVSVEVEGEVSATLGAFRDASFRVRVLALTDGPGASQALSLIEIDPHNQAPPQGRVLWSLALPGEVGRVVAGTAELDPAARPFRVALVGRSPLQVVLSHGTFDDLSPPRSFQRRVVKRAEALDGCAPALGTSKADQLVGALVWVAGDADGQPPAWHRIVWQLPSDELRTAVVTARTLTDARVLFRAPTPPSFDELVAVTLDEDRTVEVSSLSRQRTLDRWPGQPPLRAATDGLRVLLLRVDAGGPGVIDASPEAGRPNHPASKEEPR